MMARAFSFVLPPVPALLLLGLSLWRWRRPWSRWAAAAALLMLYVGGVGVVEQVLAVGLQRPFRILIDPAGAGPFDAIVVLGGSVYDAGEATQLPTMNRESTVRLAEAWRVFRRLDGSVPVVLSGGAGVLQRHPASARVMAMWLERWGVPPDRIMVEDTSTDTFGSPRAVAPRLKSGARIALITSAWHMRRALLAYERSGLRVVPAPADFLGQGGVHFGSWIPTADSTFKIQQMLREYLGLARDRWRARHP
jgi:uncharacterized SAM-binding protein YcdF (DUF218 family)